MSKTNLGHPGFSSQLTETPKPNPEGVPSSLSTSHPSGHPGCHTWLRPPEALAGTSGSVLARGTSVPVASPGLPGRMVDAGCRVLRTAFREVPGSGEGALLGVSRPSLESYAASCCRIPWARMEFRGAMDPSLRDSRGRERRASPASQGTGGRAGRREPRPGDPSATAPASVSHPERTALPRPRLPAAPGSGLRSSSRPSSPLAAAADSSCSISTSPGKCVPSGSTGPLAFPFQCGRGASLPGGAWETAGRTALRSVSGHSGRSATQSLTPWPDPLDSAGTAARRRRLKGTLGAPRANDGGPFVSFHVCVHSPSFLQSACICFIIKKCNVEGRILGFKCRVLQPRGHCRPHVLTAACALSPGGRGQDGSPVITFPDYPAFSDLPDKDFQNVMTYLTSIPRCVSLVP